MVLDLENDFPQTGIFDTVERRLKKDELINKEFKVLAFSKPINGTDGDFQVLLCRDSDGSFTTSANEIMMQRLRKLATVVGLDYEKSTDDESHFPDEVLVKLVQEKSQAKPGREYFKFA